MYANNFLIRNFFIKFYFVYIINIILIVACNKMCLRIKYRRYKIAHLVCSTCINPSNQFLVVPKSAIRRNIVAQASFKYEFSSIKRRYLEVTSVQDVVDLTNALQRYM